LLPLLTGGTISCNTATNSDSAFTKTPAGDSRGSGLFFQVEAERRKNF
jgi:hypothetical protein